jgi:phage FluMu gp28-like protein
MPKEPGLAEEIETIESDLRSVVRCTSPSGNIRFVAENKNDSHSHGDFYWALALALQAASEAGDELPVIRYSSSGRAQRKKDLSGWSMS